MKPDLANDDPIWLEAMAFLSNRPAPRSGRDRSVLVETMRLLDDPQTRYPIVHVAGTNGKGSTTHAIASVLHAAGYRTGSYFSPYLFDVTERWRIGGLEVPRSTLVGWIDALRPAVVQAESNLGAPLSEFELKTALAFHGFSEASVDIAVIEVGIGGRLDATNIIPAPTVAAITSIGLDHCQILGETRAKIAAEKAGILKTGTLACVTPVDDPEAGPVIQGIASDRGVPLHIVSANDVPRVPGFDPPYARANRATASAAVRVLRDQANLTISDGAVSEGLSARLPGRFQCISVGRRVLVLDVAHNRDGATALAEALGTEFPGRPVVAVVGSSAGHDPRDFLEPLAARLIHVVATEPLFRPCPTAVVAEAARHHAVPCETVISVAQAVETAWRMTPDDGICLISGSFYVVGETPRELFSGWIG